MNQSPGVIWHSSHDGLAPFRVYMVENVFRLPLCTNSRRRAGCPSPLSVHDRIHSFVKHGGYTGCQSPTPGDGVTPPTTHFTVPTSNRGVEAEVELGEHRVKE